jgi:hypothetical protein
MAGERSFIGGEGHQPTPFQFAEHRVHGAPQ